MKNSILVLLVLLSGNSFAQENKPKDSTLSFIVYGNCEMCKMRIEEAAKGKGVVSGVWDIDTKQFTLRYDPTQTSPEKVQQRIADVGHDTELRKAKDYVYKELPDCCLYRDGDHTHHDGDEGGILMGVVMQEDEKGNFKPLAGASLLIDGTSSGTITNENGFFTVSVKEEKAVLVVSYAGFSTKNIDVQPGQHLNIVLNAARELQEVRIVSDRKSRTISAADPLRTQVMSEKELFKAACCNLSESFETNPSVDVAYNDGVTGSKQIQLLGLSGNYTQLTVENLPGPRGIATPWGLNSIPGTWVESIQLIKGVGSVVNGFESMAGQINVELKKPENSEKLYANAYVNSMGKTDLNLNMALPVSKKWSTAVLFHNAFFKNEKVDFNKDGFRDLPTGNLFTVMNRWKFDNQRGWMGQLGGRVLLDNKTGGETLFDPDQHKGTTTHYGLGIETRRLEAFGKMGFVFPEKRYKSVGLQLATFRHEQNSYFGLTSYDASQTNFYSNLIYQSIIGNTNHKFRTGLSFVSDRYRELLNADTYNRNESVSGAFFEYNYCEKEKLDIILGLRGDYNSLYGGFLTPRIHIRYQPFDKTIVRLAAGRGQRTANIIAENASVLVSSRNLIISGAGNGKAYGLNPEVSWSQGISIDQRFRLWGKNGSLGLDYFHTGFDNQVVTDLDESASVVHFYNLEGKSYSNSVQAEINYEPVRKLEMRIAYRLFDVKTTYHGDLLERPLVAKHRGFVNLGYETGTWKFDYTVTYNGTKRIPYTGDNPPLYQLADRSPAYTVMNAQVTKTFGNKVPVDIYLGGENLGNFYQQQVILAPNDPFGPDFDATLVWGPVSGRMIYAGARLRIK